MSIATSHRSNIKNIINRSLHKLATALFLFSLLPSTYAAPSQKSGVIEATYKGSSMEFPLLKADYQVHIQGDLATIRLEQWFKNPTNEPLDATYLFPLNKDSAVYAMQMQVGDELIEAKIKRKEEAEQTFEQAKHDGKAASLLTQHRPNMFTQRLANLMPNESIRVTLQYTQHIPRIDQHYELVLPLVVGPRYMPENLKAAKSIIDQAETHNEQIYNQWELQEHPDYPKVAGVNLPKSIESERVTITVRIDGGMPIQTIRSQSHSIANTQQNDNTREITLATGKTIDNSDFILQYTLGGDAVQAGLLTHQDERGHFFTMLIEPPALPTDDQITAREMVFVLDTSGSMNGQPLNASKTFMRHAVKQLRTNDYFRIIDFGSSPREYSQTALPATTDNLYRGIQHINNLNARGGTEIVAAIEQAFKPETTANTMRIVVFLTDGYIGNEADVLAKINRLRGEARIYALGVGSSVNRYLLDEMAHAGRGFTRYIDPSKKAEDIAESAIQFANRLQTPVMTDLEIDWGDLQVDSITPTTLPDLFVGDSLRVLGKFQPLNTTGEHTVKLTGTINGKTATLPLLLSTTDRNKTANKNHQTEAIPLLWARSQIKDFMRAFNMPSYARAKHLPDNATIKQQVTELGLGYSLMTKWTSFVAVSKKIVNPNAGNNKQADIPLPMPKGVSSMAYASSSLTDHTVNYQVSHNSQFAGSSAPEPSTLWALLLLALISGFVFLRNFIRTVKVEF